MATTTPPRESRVADFVAAATPTTVVVACLNGLLLAVLNLVVGDVFAAAAWLTAGWAASAAAAYLFTHLRTRRMLLHAAASIRERRVEGGRV